MIEMQI